MVSILSLVSADIKNKIVIAVFPTTFVEILAKDLRCLAMGGSAAPGGHP